MSGARVSLIGLDAQEQETHRRLFEEASALRGQVLNIHRALANQPPALRAFLGMSRYVRDESRLDGRLREIAILLTARILDVGYERRHHEVAARRAGVTEQQLSAIPHWAESPHFDSREQAVLAYAESIGHTRRADDRIFEGLRARLSVPEIVDLTLTLGWYHLCAVILLGLEIEFESNV